MKEKTKAHLLIIGFGDLIPKLYVPIVEQNIKEGFVEGYSILDIDSQKELIEGRVESIDCKPQNIFYIPDPRPEGVYWKENDFAPVINKLREEVGNLKIIISPEVKAHEGYLRFCIENDIDSLVEKPIIAPIVDGKFSPESIEPIMQELIEKAQKGSASHSVMTLGRYSSIYNDEIFEPVKERVLDFEAPMTSLHLRTSSGVWNLHHEYEEREDHPYKYGYGMLMHGAYHYIDLMARFLDLNKLIFPDEEFHLMVSSYAAYPQDQSDRIPKKFSKKLGDTDPDWSKSNNRGLHYGETDICTTFILQRCKTKKVVTIGTLALEQTTPSIRSWEELQQGVYNKNGRTPHTDIEVQLSTLFSRACTYVQVSEESKRRYLFRKRCKNFFTR